MNECKITKDEAKILFITSLNKDTEVLLINKKQKIKNTFFLAFDTEIKTIQKRLCELNPLLVKEITKKGKYNVRGRLTNQFPGTKREGLRVRGISRNCSIGGISIGGNPKSPSL